MAARAGQVRLGGLAAAAVREADPDDLLVVGEVDRKKLAEAMVAALARGDFAAAGKDFDGAMKKALPEDKLKATWETIQKQVGPFQKQLGARAEAGGGVVVPMRA